MTLSVCGVTRVQSGELSEKDSVCDFSSVLHSAGHDIYCLLSYLRKMHVDYS